MGRIGSGAYQILSGTDLWARKEINRVLTSIDTNAANIATNTSDIATNATAIAANADDILTNFGIKAQNYFINGAMNIAERGSTVQTLTANPTYLTADRWLFDEDGTATGATTNVYRLTDPGVAGFNHHIRLNFQTTDAFPDSMMRQRIEGDLAANLAGQDVTVSFWIYREAGYDSPDVLFDYPTAKDNYAVVTNIDTVATTSTAASWQRVTATATMPSQVDQGLMVSLGATPTLNNADIYYTGLMINVGDEAQDFVSIGGDLGGELLACQRYYYRWTAGSAYSMVAVGYCFNTTRFIIPIALHTRLRYISTTITTSGAFRILNTAGTKTGVTPIMYTQPNNDIFEIEAVTTGLTAAATGVLTANNDAAAYIAIDAEL